MQVHITGRQVAITPALRKFAEEKLKKVEEIGGPPGPEPADKRTVRTIARRLAAEDYRFSRLILEIVESVPFQMRPGVAPQ